MEKDTKREKWRGRGRQGSVMSTFLPRAGAQWMCCGQDSHHGAETRSHTAQDHQKILIIQNLALYCCSSCQSAVQEAMFV